MIPSASDLTYFVEVASTLNLSRAAERLGISQPSLSLAIQRLEGDIGVDVFIRSKRGVSLTQAGKQLLNHSRHLLQSWDQVRSQALASVDEIQGSYTIGCHPSVALYSLPGLLPNLLEEHPELHVTLKHELSRKVAEGVISSTIDVGIVVNPVKHPDLVIHKLYDDEVTLWQSSSAKRKIQQPKTGEAVLICDLDLLQTQSILKQLKAKDLNFSRVLSSTSLEVITSLTANGCGLGILPSRVAALSKDKLKRVPGAPIMKDEICVIFRVENKNVRAIQNISSTLKELFQE